MGRDLIVHIAMADEIHTPAMRMHMRVCMCATACTLQAVACACGMRH